MMNKPIYFLLGILFIFLSISEARAFKNPFEAVLIRAGYGGTYIYIHSPSHPFVAIVDQFSIGLDLQTTKKIDISLNYTFPGLFQSRNFNKLNIYSLNTELKYRPFRKWYNQPYFGVGATYLKYNFDEYWKVNKGNSINLNISFGLNIQFPGKFYIIADIKNIFGNYNGNKIPIENTIFLSSSLGYRIHKSASTENK